jgi:hypothetical protein
MARKKHIEVAHLWIQQEGAKERIKVHYMNTENQAADIFTKSLSRPLFEEQSKSCLHQQSFFGLCFNVDVRNLTLPPRNLSLSGFSLHPSVLSPYNTHFKLSLEDFFSCFGSVFLCSSVNRLLSCQEGKMTISC